MLKPMDVWKASGGFQFARIILSAVELGIFEELSSGQASAERLSERCRADLRGMGYLLDALSAMGILAKSGMRYRISSSLKEGLSPDSGATILPILRHSANMWRRWAMLTKVVKSGRPAREPMLKKRGKEEMQAFIGAMHAIGRFSAGDIVKDCKVAARCRRLLDIGGASGTYTLAFLERYKGLRATIYDLPEVIPMARKRIGSTRFKSRVGFVSGDFMKDVLPKGHDLALLSAIIHQNSRAENRRLYRSVAKALAPKGILLIRDHVMNADRTHPLLGAVFAINMLVATKGGGTYTFKEISEDLRSSGFSDVRMVREGTHMDSVLQAEIS